MVGLMIEKMVKGCGEFLLEVPRVDDGAEADPLFKISVV